MFGSDLMFPAAHRLKVIPKSEGLGTPTIKLMDCAGCCSDVLSGWRCWDGFDDHLGAVSKKPLGWPWRFEAVPSCCFSMLFCKWWEMTKMTKTLTCGKGWMFYHLDWLNVLPSRAGFEMFWEQACGSSCTWDDFIWCSFWMIHIVFCSIMWHPWNQNPRLFQLQREPDVIQGYDGFIFDLLLGQALLCRNGLLGIVFPHQKK